MIRRLWTGTVSFMPSFLLHHRHDAADCPAAYAAWAGFSSPLRHRPASTTCLAGGHAIWWRVDASSPTASLGLLPPFVAHRTTVIAVREVEIP
jgi:hypothetical protein